MMGTVTKGMKKLIKQREHITKIEDDQRKLLQQEFPSGTKIQVLPLASSKKFSLYTVIGYNYGVDLKVETGRGKERWLREIPWLIEEGRLIKEI